MHIRERSNATEPWRAHTPPGPNPAPDDPGPDEIPDPGKHPDPPTDPPEDHASILRTRALPCRSAIRFLLAPREQRTA
jgi:hypothetical protein